MIIEVLNQNYKCGCNRGLSCLEVPGILNKLNSIIEWDFCKFPIKTEELDETEKVVVGTDDNGNDIVEEKKKIIKAEDREFLGQDPELKPGNVFLFNGGQVIAVDSPDRLVLIVSETGIGALDRIYEENIETEFSLLYNNYQIYSGNVEVVESGITPEGFDLYYSVPYNLYKIWKERYVTGRGYLEKGLCLKVTLESEDFIFPIEAIMTDWSMIFKSSQIDEEMIETAAKEILSWFYESYKRIVPLKTEANENNQNQF